MTVSRRLLVIAAGLVLLPDPSVRADPNRWSPTGPGGGRITLVQIDPATPATVWAVADGMPFRSTDGGATWSERSSGIPLVGGFGMTSLVIDAGVPSTLNALTAGSSLFRSTDGGANWVRGDVGENLPSLTALVPDPFTAGTLYVVAGQMQLRRSTDAGVTWASLGVPAAPPGSIPSFIGMAVDPLQPSTFYMAVFEGSVHQTKIFVSTDGAASWALRDSGLPAAESVGPLVLASTNPPTLYITYPSGLFRSRDRGLTWSQDGLGRTDVHVLAADPSAPTTLYGIVADTELLRSTDDGATWQDVDVRVPRFIVPSITTVTVDPTDSARLYVGTTLDGVFVSDDGGASWTLGERGLSRRNLFKEVLLEPGTDTLYVTSWRAALWKSTDGGQTWTPRNPAPEPLASGETFSAAMDPATPQTLYLGSNQRGVFKSADGAATWSPANTGLTDLHVRAIAVDPNAPATVFAATPSGLFRSADGAASWSLHDPAATTITALAVDPVLPARLYANTGELTSADGGVSFGPSTFAPVGPNEVGRAYTALALAPVPPASAWVGLEVMSLNGFTILTSVQLFRSTDGLQTGTAVASGRFDAAEVDPSDPTALWAARYSRPGRSRDGGVTFSPFAAGLPLDVGGANGPWAFRFGVRDTGSAVYLTTTGLGVFRLDLPPCASDGDCDDGESCTTDTCDAGRCDHTAVADSTSCAGRDVCAFAGRCASGECRPTAALCDDGDGCTSDHCLTSGTCEHVYTCLCPPGAPDTDGDGVCDAADDCPADPDPLQKNLDGDGRGDVCDPFDAPLLVERVRLRTGTSGTVVTKGRFTLLGGGDAFDPSGGMAVVVGDGVAPVVSHAWPAGECTPKSTGVTCRSVDGRARVRVSGQRTLPAEHRFSVKLKGVALAGSPTSPVTVTVTESGPRIDRVGTISACTVTTSGLTCRQR